MYGNNHMIGAIRIRQMKVKLSTEVNTDLFGSEVQWKYPEWSTANQDTATFGPTASPYVWSETQEGVLDHFSGRYDYPSEGYVELIDSKLNRTQALNILNSLQGNSWTGMGTRLVVIDVNVYNPNIELFCICRIGVEFLPSGFVVPSSVMLPVVLTRYEKASGVLWATLEFILYAYVIALTGSIQIHPNPSP